jgi:hypothetical protein
MILEAATWAQWLVSIGLIVDSCERLVSYRDYADDNLLSGRLFRHLDGPWLLSLLRRSMCRQRVFQLVLVARIALLLIALLPLVSPPARATLLGLVFGAQLLIGIRSSYGSDGSDQMDQVVLAGLVAAFGLASSSYAWIGLAFIAAQSLLSCATAGWAKLLSPVWREGTAVPAILGTGTYGNQGIAQLFASKPTLGVMGSRAVIALECLFPLCLILPLWGLVAVLAFGAALHLSIAITMGLNKFLLSWLATYPAIIACHQLLH